MAYSKSPEIYNHAYKVGHPVLIGTGWEKHFLTILFFNQHLFIVNKGERDFPKKLFKMFTLEGQLAAKAQPKPETVVTYRIDPSKVSLEIFKAILEFKDYSEPLKEIWPKIYLELIEKIQWDKEVPLPKDAFSDYVDNLEAFKDQKVGNCSVANFRAALSILISAALYKHGIKNSIQSVSRKIYKDVDNFLREEFYKKYTSLRISKPKDIDDKDFFKNLETKRQKKTLKGCLQNGC